MVPAVMPESYVWTKDSELRVVSHPDGTSTSITRDAAGRVTQVASPWASSTMEYLPTTGQPVSTTRDGQRLDWRFDGALPLSEASSGIVRGAVSWKYDSDFRVTDVAVNDAGVSYSYDTDGLLLSAGPVSLSRIVVGPATSGSKSGWLFP